MDLQTESLISFADAPAHIPGHPHIATVHRYRLRGSHGVKLETVKVGGRRFTSVEAIERFIRCTTEAADGNPSPAQSTRRQQQAAAKRELAEAGI